MTTTAAATVAISGNALLELLDRVDRDDEISVAEEEHHNSMCARARGLGLLHGDRFTKWSLTAAGRDILRACTGGQ